MSVPRNIFDQYEQPENRLTHALATTLSHERKLLRPFLRWVGVSKVPALRDLRITQQQVPGELIPADEPEAAGLPDLCVFNNDGWAVMFEAKVQARLRVSQLGRHANAARRHGFENPQIVVLSVEGSAPPSSDGVRVVPWRDVYAWFGRHSRTSFWALQLVQYMRVFETRMVNRDYAIRGTITMFDGLQFDPDNPYTYSEAKRLIRLLGDELQKRKDLHRIGVDPNGSRRTAITGRDGTRVWDFLPLRAARGAAHTAFPHLTMDIGHDEASAAITVPHGVRGGLRTTLQDLGEEGFVELMYELLTRLAPLLRHSPGASPRAYLLQRHYRSQRSAGVVDGRVAADLRTLTHDKAGGVKYQPQWIEMIYRLLAEKRSNIQLGVVVAFQYDCPRLRSPKAVDLFAETWIALSPVLDLLLDGR